MLILINWVKIKLKPGLGKLGNNGIDSGQRVDDTPNMIVPLMITIYYIRILYLTRRGKRMDAVVVLASIVNKMCTMRRQCLLVLHVWYTYIFTCGFTLEYVC